MEHKSIKDQDQLIEKKLFIQRSRMVSKLLLDNMSHRHADSDWIDSPQFSVAELVGRPDIEIADKARKVLGLPRSQTSKTSD